jgi:hypothetical protein
MRYGSNVLKRLALRSQESPGRDIYIPPPLCITIILHFVYHKVDRDTVIAKTYFRLIRDEIFIWHARK